MIDDGEINGLSEWDEAFLEQWLKLWFAATEALQLAGWRPAPGLHSDMWTPPVGVLPSVWAAACVKHDAEDARSIRAKSNDPYVHDAADTLIALWSIAEAISEAGAEKAAARRAALWGMNAAAFTLRRNPRTLFARTSVALTQELRKAREALAPRLRVVARQSEAAYDTAEKRRDAWWPRGKELARKKLAEDPRASNAAIADVLHAARGEEGFAPPGYRQIERAVSAWRGAPDGIPMRPGG